MSTLNGRVRRLESDFGAVDQDGPAWYLASLRNQFAGVPMPDGLTAPKPSPYIASDVLIRAIIAWRGEYPDEYQRWQEAEHARSL